MTMTYTKLSHSETVKAAFLIPPETGTLLKSITTTFTKPRTWKEEPFEYNGGWCIGAAF